MSDVDRPSPMPGDTVTPRRDISHQHFAAGDLVIIVQGAYRGELTGAEMTVVASSWHTPTDEPGWRLHDPHGGARSYITAHPRHLIHSRGYCPDCTLHLNLLRTAILPHVPTDRRVNGGWYRLTPLDQLVHYADPLSD